MANKGKKDNKLKRKRGKKFRFYDQDGAKAKKEVEENPFENHSSSKKAVKDKLKRAELIQEYTSRGKNNVFVDKRIGQNSSKLSEEDKMRLRYLKEQRDQIRNVKVSKKRNKYNLDDLNSDDEGAFMGFTHGGRQLEDYDDFRDEIPLTSEDEDNDEDVPGENPKGKLNDEMVMKLNFGGGKQEAEDAKKTRKEVFEEIIAKSKAYKMANYEVKQATAELQGRLDNQFFDILSLLDMSKTRKYDIPDTKTDKSYELIAFNLREEQKAVPTQVLMTDKEQARVRREKLEEMESKMVKTTTTKKREEKDLDKREKAIYRIQKNAIDVYKNDIKVSVIEDQMKEKIDKVKKQQKFKEEIDSELVSEEEQEEDDEEEYGSEVDEDDDDDDEEGEGSEEINDEEGDEDEELSSSLDEEDEDSN